MAAIMGEAFESSGHPADLLSNTYPSVGTVLDALDQLAALWDEFTVVRVLAPLSRDPVVSVERDERVTRVDMSALLRQFVSSRTGQPTVDNLEQVMGGLRRWVDTLPVSDREAEAKGIRLVTWAAPARTSLALAVVAPRRKTLTSWTPSATLSPSAVHLVRLNATEHAVAQLKHVDCAPDGTAFIWRHRDPRLSGVIFADGDPARRWQTPPDLRLSGVIFADPDPVRRWQTEQNLVCVYTPGFPVVGASPAAALRLAEETMVDHQLLTFPSAAHLEWKS
jgi:hypothetical protein